MRRLWTLHEGILGKTITLQLRDGTIGVNVMDGRLR